MVEIEDAEVYVLSEEMQLTTENEDRLKNIVVQQAVRKTINFQPSTIYGLLLKINHLCYYRRLSS